MSVMAPARRSIAQTTLDVTSADEHTRVRLAARAGTPAHILKLLAEDPAITVRAAVAMNPGYSPAVDRQLMGDSDERVRSLLATKLANLLPGLSAEQHATAGSHVRRTLAVLARDAAVMVRATIAQTLQAMPEAPRDLILKLANDADITVSDPVIRLSPLLTDADLIELLAEPAHPRTPVSVARRLGLGACVADHIASHADDAAIRALLGNASASIQEATLDALVGRAAEHPEWHEPLVHRPNLPGRTALALSRIIAGNLLNVLVQRADLPPSIVTALREQLALSMEPLPEKPVDVLLDEVRQMNIAGQLTEASLSEALVSGDNRRVAAILSVASGVPWPAIERAATLRNAKALVSLVWKAGFSMQSATSVQTVLGQLGPTTVIAPTELGAYPLGATEMDWQIEVMTGDR